MGVEGGSEHVRLILWDIDGTLIRAGRVAREVVERAVAAEAGAPLGEHGVRMSGKTDPQIVTELLASLGQAHRANALLPAVLERLAAELAQSEQRVREEGRVLPGVTEALARLHRAPGVSQAVLTGNIAPNARRKLAALGLEGWFDWRQGAFGSDHRDRTELVAVARSRAVAALGREPSPVWVVGDTPNDLACARAGSARCLLVATGRFDVEALSGLGADAVLADLSDAERVTGTLTS